MQALPMITPNIVSMALTLSARRACTATWNVSPQTIEILQFSAQPRGHARNRVFSKVFPTCDAKSGACLLHSGGVRHGYQHHFFGAGVRCGGALPAKSAAKTAGSRA